MPEVSQDVVAVLEYLLPGFLCAWVYYGLTSYSERSEFERVVQALIFTLLVQAVVYPTKAALLWVGMRWPVADWPANGDLVLSVVSAFVVGAAISFFANNDHFHRALRFIKVTRETSYPSEWFGAFCKNVTYVVLHLKSDVRIYGWPIEWPSDPNTGHFLLVETSWLDEDNKEIAMTNVRQVLVPVADVGLVEFMDLNWRKANEERIKSAAAAGPPASPTQ